MPQLHLTEIAIRALKPTDAQVDYWDKTTPGFGVRVGARSKTFIAKANNRRFSVGRFPMLSLSDARTAAKKLLAAPPSLHSSLAFEAAFALFLAEKKKVRRAKTTDEYERLIGRHFRFKCQLGAISHDDFAKKLNHIEARSERDHALVAARIFFTWCVKRRHMTENPTISISQGKHVARSRVLSDDELKRVWMATEQIGGSFGTIVKLLVLTGQRRGEIAALQTSWINLGDKTITLPSEITKNKREHTFPIGLVGCCLLETFLPRRSTSTMIFPARGHTTVAFNGWSKSKVALDKISGVSEWTLHDIRRTVASNLAALGVQLPVIERLLNHVSGSFGGIVSVYQKHSFMPEMRAAIEKWETHLSALIKSE